MADDGFKSLTDDPALTSTLDSDLGIAATTLRKVLLTYPGTMTLEELVRGLTLASTDFGERDSIERAVRDLAASGLVHRNGNFVVPTMAAVKFWALSDV